MLFATEFSGYFGSWVTDGVSAIPSIRVTEDILDFDTIGPAWQNELDNRKSAAERGRLAGVVAAHPDDPADPSQRREALIPDYGKWQTVRELGRGGQGKVFLAHDTTKYRIEDIAQGITNSVIGISGRTQQEYQDSLKKAHDFAQSILKYSQSENAEHCGALKVLHQPENAKSYPGKQIERMKHEVYALKEGVHPNIAKLLDERIEDRWFVTEYFVHGNLNENRTGYESDLLRSLLALRPLIEGVAVLHKRNLVHRDIKPENIFVSDDRGLVLGDFGLVYFADEQRSRLSDTYENVGSRDWMPGWAMGMRVDEIKPNFDVFCLGKLLWWMVSGRSVLRLWYTHRDDFELERMFPNEPDTRWARIILDKCVVEHPEQCLPDAETLLAEVNRVLSALRRPGYRGQCTTGVPRVWLGAIHQVRPGLQ